MKSFFIFLFLVAVGFLIAFATASSSGEREAWDSTVFWGVALPALILVAGVAGYAEPTHFLFWGIAVVAGLWLQILTASKLGSLWFVGLLFSLLLAIVCDLAAALGAALRRRMLARTDRMSRSSNEGNVS